jgi:hypothetical protein
MMLQPLTNSRLSRPAAPPHGELQALVGRALVDECFRRDLLNGHRRERLGEFRLSPEELAAAASIDADDLGSFAAGLDTWIRNSTAGSTGDRRANRLAAAA